MDKVERKRIKLLAAGTRTKRLSVVSGSAQNSFLSWGECRVQQQRMVKADKNYVVCGWIYGVDWGS